MRLIRIWHHTPLAAGTTVTLSPSAGNHVSRVLRLQAGDTIRLFDGAGSDYDAVIRRVGGARVDVDIGATLPAEPPPPLAITLVQAVSRNERMDYALQKATELGVAQIVPVLTGRSVVRLDGGQGERKQQHWQQVVIAACEQSGRSRVPAVSPPCTLEAYCTTSAPTDPASTPTHRLLLDPEATDALAQVAAQLAGADAQVPVQLLIGPEGGFTEHERELARSAHFRAVRLGPRILRTETAAVAAITVLQAIAGDLR